MENKTVFVRTSKGEAEASGRTSLLFGDAKRAFILVNNKATVEDLRKQAAPSLRPLIDEVLEQLERDDFIRDKDDAGQKKSMGGEGGNIPKMSVPKIAVPTKAAVQEEIDAGEDELDFTNLAPMSPQDSGADKTPAGVETGSGVAEELDFSSILQTPAQNVEADRAKEEAEARIRAEAEAKARMRAEMEAKMRAEAEAKARAEAAAKARSEAEARMRAEAEAKARVRAEMEAKMRAEAEAKARAEAEARMRAEAEAKARVRAEMEAKMRAEAEAKTRAEAEARMRAEMEARVRAEAEARAKAEASKKTGAAEGFDFSSLLQVSDHESDADKVRAEAEAKARMEVEARTLAEAEAKARARAEVEAKARAESEARARVRAELEAGMRSQAEDAKAITGKNHGARSMIATVLFFDVVGYTKQSVARQIELKGQFNTLISGFIGHVDEDQRIILDTGDGAAIGFMQHPEDALDVAMKFRAAVTANNHRDYPELKVRAGIHLGPVSVVRDMNGQLNMVGDGINDAQRIMSFAGVDQIYVSRAYFDVISRLTADSARLFKYNGTQKDKHGREHQVYLVLGEGASAPAHPMNHQAGGLESLMLDLSSLMKDTGDGVAASQAKAGIAPAEAPAGWQPMEMPPSSKPRTPQEIEADARMAAKIKAEQAADAARLKAQQDAAAIRMRAEHEAARAKQEEASRKLASEQARAFAEAEMRAKERAEAEVKAREREAKQTKTQASTPAAKAARRKSIRKPVPWITLGFTLIILAVVGVLALPYVWPMQDYVVLVEKELSDQLKQPVHIGGMSAASLPSPRLDLRDITVGSGKELKIGHIALYFDVLTLPANIRVIEKAELEKVEFSAESFSKALPWLQAMGSNARYPLARMALHGVHVSGDVPVLPALDGNMEFDAYGRFAKVSLSSDDGKLSVALQPQEGRMQLDVSIKDSHLPLLPNIQFSSLNATGDVGNGAINFNSIDGSVYGGTLKGSANLAWQGGWQLQGHLNLSNVPAEKALPGLRVAGALEGEAGLVMSGAKLMQLASAPHLEGAVRIKDGAINSMDIMETMRSGKKHLAAGSTHFDILNVAFLADSGGQHLKQISVTAGAMTMNGSAEVTADGKLTGQMLVDLNKVRAGMGTLPLALSGMVAEPVWSIGGR